MGNLPLTGWWTYFDGYVFDDANRNGVMDPGRRGLANYTLDHARAARTPLMDRGATTWSTRPDACGHYVMENAYPMTQWLVMEAYNDLPLHDRRHLPGRQPADPDDAPGCRRRRQRAARSSA